VRSRPAQTPCRLLFAQVAHDSPTQNVGVLRALDGIAAAAAATPLAAADLEYAKAIAMFDEDALLFFPDVRECADSAAYHAEAVALRTKAPATVGRCGCGSVAKA